MATIKSQYNSGTSKAHYTAGTSKAQVKKSLVCSSTDCQTSYNCGQYTINFSGVTACTGLFDGGAEDFADYPQADELNGLGNIILTWDNECGDNDPIGLFTASVQSPGSPSFDWHFGITDCSCCVPSCCLVLIVYNGGFDLDDAMYGFASELADIDDPVVSNKLKLGNCGTRGNFDNACTTNCGAYPRGWACGYNGYATLSYDTTGCP